MTEQIVLIICVIIESAVIIYQAYTIRKLNNYAEVWEKIARWWEECSDTWKLLNKTEKDYTERLLKYIEELESIHTPDERK